MFGRAKAATEMTISNRTIIRIISFIVGTGLLVRLFENMRHPLTLIFVSFFLSMALNPAVNWVSRRFKSKSRVRATTIAYLTVTTLLVAFFSLVLPPLISQTTDFIKEVPNTLNSLDQKDNAVGNFIRRYDLQTQVGDLAKDWSKNIGSFSGPVLSTANRIVSNIVSIIVVFVLTFMMLVEGPGWLIKIWKHMPEEKRPRAKILATKMYNVVTSYVNGQVIVAAIGSSFALVAMLIASNIFNVSINAAALAGLVFMFGLIPTVGSFLSISVVFLFCLFVSGPLALTMLVYFVVYQQIENATVQPYIQSRGIELTPMLVFISAILGIGLGGILGGFLSIPIAGSIKVLIDDYLERQELPEKVK